MPGDMRSGAVTRRLRIAGRSTSTSGPADPLRVAALGLQFLREHLLNSAATSLDPLHVPIRDAIAGADPVRL
jgi:hypothetical protein